MVKSTISMWDEYKSDFSVFSLHFSSSQGRGALQDIDQLSLFKPLCKFCASVNTVKDIAPVLRKAIAVAQCNTPGMSLFY